MSRLDLQTAVECVRLEPALQPVKGRTLVSPRYRVAFTEQQPSLEDASDPIWNSAERLEVASFHARTGSHRPQTSARMLYNVDGIFLRFTVRDRYVRCVHTRYQDPVSQDSCVEWFVEPWPGRGYYNFEINCGGTLLLGYHPPGLRPVQVAERQSWKIRIHSSLPPTINPEISVPLDWTVACFVPFSYFGHGLEPGNGVPGQVWRANFYKCGSATSHPHWASWSPIGDRLSFHQPETFGEIYFSSLNTGNL